MIGLNSTIQLKIRHFYSRKKGGKGIKGKDEMEEHDANKVILKSFNNSLSLN